MTRPIVAARDGVALTEPTQDERRQLALEHPLALAVIDRGDGGEGRLLGGVHWQAVEHAPDNVAWRVGIELLPATRDHGATALQLLVEHLFAATVVDRIEASAGLADTAARALLASAGFRREGVLRGDRMLGYSLLRTDVEPGPRVTVVSQDGVALATYLPEDRVTLAEHGDGAFDVDPDDRPALHVGFEVYRLAVLDTGSDTVVGEVSWHAVGYGHTAACSAWNIGIVLSPAVRGRGFGATAVRLLVEHLFATTEVDRVEASTDRENIASQRALTKAGLRREGVFRGAQLRGGARRDMIAYSILRDDLPKPDGEREIVAFGDGIVLGETLPGDQELLRQSHDGPFDPDPDPDNRPLQRVPDIHRLTVLDQHTDELIGSVSWHAVGYGRTAACEAWNVGIGLLPGSRGRGAGATALRLLAEYLLASSGIDRIEAETDRENIPAQRALAKAGFRAEGMVRGAQLRDGRRTDMVSYSLLRTDLAETAESSTRDVLLTRDGIALAGPAPGDREKFHLAAAGDFAIDPDDRPRLTGLAHSSLLAVVDTASGELLGGVSWHAVDYGGTVSSSAWNIGIGLLPPARGRGVGTVAQRLLVEHLFATTELDRVEASTDVDNIAEQRALEKAGFRREGVLRGAQMRGGVRRDLVHYGLVRGDLQL